MLKQSRLRRVTMVSSALLEFHLGIRRYAFLKSGASRTRPCARLNAPLSGSVSSCSVTDTVNLDPVV